MTLKLAFRSPHLSIQQFPTIILPSLSVITGKNGSGKSHLLEAIGLGRVQCTKDGGEINDYSAEIRSYNWTTLIPQDVGVYSSVSSRNERRNAVAALKNMLTSHGITTQLRNLANNNGLPALSDKQLLRCSRGDLAALGASEVQ